MFGWARDSLVAERVSDAIQETLRESLGAGGHVTPARLGKVRMACTRATSRVVGADLLGKRRISLWFLGQQIDVACNSSTEEIELRLAAILKEDAISKGQLPSFLLESDLGSPGCERYTFDSIDPEVLAKFHLCRTKTSRLWKQYKGGDEIELMVKLLQTKANFVTSIDQTAVLEITWISAMVDRSGEAELQKAVLNLLPTGSSVQEQYPSLTGILQGLEALETRPLFKLAQKAVQGSVRAIGDVLKALDQGRAPALNVRAVSSFHAACFARCEHLLWVDVVGKQAGTTRRLSGRDAFHHILSELKRKSNEEITLEALNKLMAFKWMATQQEAEYLDDALASALKGAQGGGQSAGGGKGASASSKRGQASGSKGGAAKKQRQKAVDAHVASLFAM
jgi:hypothetical protein